MKKITIEQLEVVKDVLTKLNEAEKIDSVNIKELRKIGKNGSETVKVLISKISACVATHNTIVPKSMDTMILVLFRKIQELNELLSDDNIEKYMNGFEKLPLVVKGNTHAEGNNEILEIRKYFDKISVLTCFIQTQTTGLDFKKDNALNTINTIRRIVKKHNIQYDNIYNKINGIIDTILLSDSMKVEYNAKACKIEYVKKVERTIIVARCFKPLLSISKNVLPILKAIENDEKVPDLIAVYRRRPHMKPHTRYINKGFENRCADKILEILSYDKDMLELEEIVPFSPVKRSVRGCAHNILNDFDKEVKRRKKTDAKLTMIIQKLDVANTIEVLNDMFDCSKGIHESKFAQIFIEASVEPDRTIKKICDIQKQHLIMDNTLFRTVDFSKCNNLFNIPLELSELMGAKQMSVLANITSATHEELKLARVGNRVLKFAFAMKGIYKKLL